MFSTHPTNRFRCHFFRSHVSYVHLFQIFLLAYVILIEALLYQHHLPTSDVFEVFLAVPGLSDVKMEVQTGTQNRPAMLLRTAQGAVCPAEALIGSHCRALNQHRQWTVCFFVGSGFSLSSHKATKLCFLRKGGFTMAVRDVLHNLAMDWYCRVCVASRGV